MKKSIMLLVIVLLGLNFTSCTAESLEDENQNVTATVGDNEKVPAEPDDDDEGGEGNGGN